jgi:hypothetical protein
VGDGPSLDPAMTNFCWQLVDLLSRMLQPDERDAVLGDQAESGASGGQALRDLLGLIVRRQVELWQRSHSWLALAGLVIPLGALLTVVSRRTANGNAIYLWLYANNWTWTYVTNAGFRGDFVGYGTGVVISWIELICWSWTGGLLLGYVSRRTTWSNAVLLSFGLLLGVLLHPPPFIDSFFLSVHSNRVGPDPNSAAYAVAFYRVAFPLIVQYVLVLLPSLLGMRQGLRTSALPFSLRTILWTSAAVSMASLVTQSSLWWQLRTWQLYPLRLPRLPSLHLVAAAGPIGYMIVTSILRRSWGGTVAIADNPTFKENA